MSANLNRRGILGLFGAAPIVTAANAVPAAGSVFGRLRPGFTGDFRAARYAGLTRFADAVEAASPVLTDERIADLARFLDRRPVDVGAPPTAKDAPAIEARAIAALAIDFPPEIAAYRSFAPHLRRRLYAEMLVRRAHHLNPAEPPTRSPAPPDVGA